jgi:hypothetical protein
MCLAGGFKWRGFSERLGDRICFGTISPSLEGRHRLWLEDWPLSNTVDGHRGSLAAACDGSMEMVIFTLSVSKLRS